MKKPTMPTRSLLQGAEYVPAAATDIRARFERMRQEQAKPANVQQLQRRNQR